ncbi:S8 family serine peptidase [Cellulomonas aerilata]|uniref:Peptidase S8/S53 domain-containing protein n=1 Tax=Cellulomonas aerilata TaxID=515326 RepID=A0A512DFI2_9CELL|nr:S8 family serine peptidase [Cellulomonas aerilata]GEO35244.1 hypothetical protein CAE01nite_29690 [Cellulomonas aerilata]
MGRGARAAVALAAAGLAGTLPAAQAAAADRSEQFDAGQWWIDAMGVRDAHQQVTGDGVTIALLDAPIYPDAPELQGQDVVPSGTRCEQPMSGTDGPASVPSGPISEVTWHTASMAAMLVGNGQGTRPPDGRGLAGIAPGATLRTYAVYDTREERRTGPSFACLHGERDDGEFLREVLAADPDVVLVTVGWRADVQDVVNEGIADGVVFVNGAGNEGPDGSILGFGDLDGVVNVVAGDQDGLAAEFNSADWRPVDYVTESRSVTTDPGAAVAVAPYEGGAGRATIMAPGVDLTAGGLVDGRWESDVMNSGTSGASALTAGALALVMERWPAATGNQVLQSLVRNANHPNDVGFATSYGFGGLSLPTMLAEDPAGYPDVHPFYGGVRWAFEDDPPAPTMTERGPDGVVELWEPTYTQDELQLPWPLGPALPSDGSTATPPAARADDGGSVQADAAGQESASGVEADGPPWGRLGAAGVLGAALVGAGLWARARRKTDDIPDGVAAGGGSDA